MTAIENHIARINRARDMEALSDISRDIEALMTTEHASAAEKEAVTDAVMKKTQALARRLMAG